MTTLTIVSDWHLGAVRSAGTTPATALQLRKDLLTNAEEILYGVQGDLLINGDLFDSPNIARYDLLQAIRIFSDWLTRRVGHLYLSNGNHDLDKDSTRLSSFQFFAELLIDQFGPARVTHITEGFYIQEHDTYVIPHVTNQDLFNLELKKVSGCAYLCVHANYDNGFAVESDHSLNMSLEQAALLPVTHIIFGHEHQQKTALDGKVQIIGNSFPSSVSDCLGNDSKQLAVITSEHRLVKHSTWHAKDDYHELPWTALKDTGARFIRVTGEATAEEAGAVVTTISRFRAESAALVITNAVRVAGVNDAEEMQLTHEEITSFNVRAALRDLLTDEENEKLDKLGVS